MASEDKLASQMENLTTDATPIPPAEVAATAQENVAIGDSLLHNLSDGNESQESDEHGEPQEETTFHEEDHESTETIKHDETDELGDLDNLSSEKTPEGNTRKVPSNLIAKDKKSSTDRRLTKPDNSGLLKPGPSSVVYNITDASNVHVGPVVTVNLSSTQAKSPQMAAPKKTKDIAELLQSITPVSEEDIDTVSPHVGHGWRKLGRQLKFTDGQLDQFEANFTLEGRKEVIYQMLMDWKRAETDKATRGILCSALWSAKQYDPVRILARRKVKTEA